jgi:transposase
MAPIPSLEEEDARRLNRERQNLSSEASRIVNRMRASLARLGISTLNVKLPGAAARLDVLRTGEGAALPPLTRAELRREMARLALIRAQLKEIDAARQEQLQQAPAAYRGKVKALSQVYGLGAATADMLTVEVFSRGLRDRRAVARGACPRAARSADPWAGLTGAPDESGKKRREKGLARAGNARVRHGMIQLAWRFLKFQPDSALVRWYRAQTASGRSDIRKTMIVALARKLLVALWRLTTTGEVPHGLRLQPAI